MESSATYAGGRSLIERHNPETIVLAPRDQHVVSVSLDLGSSFVAVTYDHRRAAALYQELGVALDLLGPREGYR